MIETRELRMLPTLALQRVRGTKSVNNILLSKNGGNPAESFWIRWKHVAVRPCPSESAGNLEKIGEISTSSHPGPSSPPHQSAVAGLLSESNKQKQTPREHGDFLPQKPTKKLPATHPPRSCRRLPSPPLPLHFAFPPFPPPPTHPIGPAPAAGGDEVGRGGDGGGPRADLGPPRPPQRRHPRVLARAPPAAPSSSSFSASPAATAGAVRALRQRAPPRLRREERVRLRQGRRRRRLRRGRGAGRGRGGRGGSQEPARHPLRARGPRGPPRVLTCEAPAPLLLPTTCSRVSR